MSATHSITARPAWAVTAWVDNTHVYIEIPAAKLGDPPYIEKHSLTEGGLGKALGFMKSLHAKHEPQGGYYQLPEMKITRKGPTVIASEGTREKVRAILRSKGLV